MPHIAFYITGHGFGHATRMAAVARALCDRVPGTRLSLLTTVPEWLLRLSLSAPFSLRPVALDVGVVQCDAIRLDARATLEAYATLLPRMPFLVAEEVERLRQAGVHMVVADIPPAAFRIARRLGVPGVGISNFSWDWVYADYAREAPEYRGLIEAIRADYAGADQFLRLPFHGPCDAFPVVRDIPMVARRAQEPREMVRGRLGVNGGRPVVLLSFGGFDVQGIDFDRVEQLEEYQFLTTQPLPRPVRNVRVLPLGRMPYEALVAQADVVIAKPGYGIVSDCLVNRTPVLYTPRGQFAEYGCLVEGLQRFGVAEAISTADFLAGEWRVPLARLLDRPAIWPDLPADGAVVAAEALRALL
jgi:L-arabinokinase